MPDLRDELGRLADFVGEPVGLDELAMARRRRERRRRTAGLVGGLAVVALIAAIALSSLGDGGDSAVPVTTGSPEPAADCLTGSSLLIGTSVRYQGVGATNPEYRLSACTEWPAGLAIAVTLNNQVRNIPLGLAVYDAANCNSNGCDGDPIWMMDPIVGPGKGFGTIPALLAGHYVLLDPVHPPTTLLPVTVGDARPTPSSSPHETPSSQQTGGDVPIPADLASIPLTECLPTNDATITERSIALTGCGFWTAGQPITVRFERKDERIVSGLMLFPLRNCDGDVCNDPTWEAPLAPGPRTFSQVIGPLEPGRYVLVDPVHPSSAVMLVEVVR